MDIETLVKDCQEGNTQAFGNLYRIFSLPMMEVIGCYISNRETAKDILHDGFIIAYTSISSLKDAAKVESWLTTIMRNLALQYLRESTNHITVPLSGITIFDRSTEQSEEVELTWEELEKIISKLPAGYGKVFRLNVLDGLSHAEISRMLGISHLTSASQLHHAKALLRNLINKYRMEMGIVSSIVIISLMVYNAVIRRTPHRNPIITNEPLTVDVAGNEKTIVESDSPRQPVQIPSALNRHENREETRHNETAITTPDVRSIRPDSSTVDTVNPVLPPKVFRPLRASHSSPKNNNLHSSSDEWSLSLAYSGIHGRETGMRTPGAGFPSDIPGLDSEERQTVRYYPPFTFGVTVSKCLSERWSIESGLRYTYLRTDQSVETEFRRTESIEKIHYLGVPVKIIYKAFHIHRFSGYGQGGVLLEIPLRGTTRQFEVSEYDPSATAEKYSLSLPVQLGLEGGIGIQYQLTSSFSLYVEPSLRYYFNSGQDIRTIRQEKPFDLTIPVGIRMTW